MHVHGVDLPAGTVSVGHFWTDRHYNVYHWLDRRRRNPRVLLQHLRRNPHRRGPIEWRDLTVDVLALPGGRLDVLDEHELPADLPPEIAAHIAAGKARSWTRRAAVMAEIERGVAARSLPLEPG